MIREANINDSSRLAEIRVFAWRCTYKDFISLEELYNKMTVKNCEEMFNKWLSESTDKSTIYVYEENNIVKGYMIIGNCRDEDKNDLTYEIWAIYIDPLFQRQNIGTQFVNYCLKEAKNKDKKEITLWVFEKNINTIIFYEKMGFVKDGNINTIEYFNENEVRMSMRI